MKSNESGATFLELAVIIVVIGLIAALAIAQFEQYQTRALKAKVINDLHSIIKSQETLIADGTSYVTCTGLSTCESVLPGFQGSDANYATFTVGSLAGGHYSISLVITGAVDYYYASNTSIIVDNA